MSTSISLVIFKKSFAYDLYTTWGSNNERLFHVDNRNNGYQQEDHVRLFKIVVGVKNKYSSRYNTIKYKLPRLFF